MFEVVESFEDEAMRVVDFWQGGSGDVGCGGRHGVVF